MMQKHEKKLIKTKYNHDQNEYIVLNKCPHCDLEIHPTVEKSYRIENKSYVIHILSLLCPSCRKDYFTLNDFRAHTTDEDKYLFTIPEYSFSDESLIQNTSKKFQNLYIQAVNSELLGHHDIAFFGYIKSLEILVKDIAIIEHPDSEDMVLFSNLIQCLEKFHSKNIHLFSKKLRYDTRRQ